MASSLKGSSVNIGVNSSDPSGVQGDIHYNSTDNTINVYNKND